MRRSRFRTSRHLGLILVGAGLVGGTTAWAGASTILNEDFKGESISSLESQGWSFSGNTLSNQNPAERVHDGFTGGANDKALLVGGDSGDDPIFAQKPLSATVSKGSLSFAGATAASSVRAKIHLQDSSGNNFFTYSLTSADTYRIEDVNSGERFYSPSGFDQKGYSGGNHYAQVNVQWDGKDIEYRVKSINADDGTIDYDSGLTSTTSATTGGEPNTLRIDVDRHDNNARVAGYTNLVVTNDVPEPGTLSLILGAMAAGLLGRPRRRAPSA